MVRFHFGREVGALLISLFVAGYCVGPLIWGPLSEQYGRRPISIVSFLVYTCFQVGCALSPNTASILIFRFLGGTFAAAPLTNSGYVAIIIASRFSCLTFLSLVASSPIFGMLRPEVLPLLCSLWHHLQGRHWDQQSEVLWQWQAYHGVGCSGC